MFLHGKSMALNDVGLFGKIKRNFMLWGCARDNTIEIKFNQRLLDRLVIHLNSPSNYDLKMLDAF